MPSCPFCAPAVDRLVLVENACCVGLPVRDGPPGGAIVVPRVHRTSPFELTDEELVGTRDLLAELRDLVASVFAPDGWNVGWNVGRVGGQEVEHVHCHLVPRFADEAYAGRGLRWWIKQPENARQGTSVPDHASRPGGSEDLHRSHRGGTGAEASPGLGEDGRPR